MFQRIDDVNGFAPIDAKSVCRFRTIFPMPSRWSERFMAIFTEHQKGGRSRPQGHNGRYYVVF
jgi:hypothetical protein